MSKEYRNPITGSILEWKGENFWYDPTTDEEFVVDKNNRVNPFQSPIHGGHFYRRQDGLFATEYGDELYKLTNDGKLKVLKDPIYGAELYPNGDGLYKTEYGDELFKELDDGRFIPFKNKVTGAELSKVFDDGTVLSLKDPYCGGELVANQDGTYHSPSTDEDFVLDGEKKRLIPFYIPGKDYEKAHLENGQLVGNISGKRYDIDEKGNVITPEFIEKMERDEKTKAFLANQYYGEFLEENAYTTYCEDVKKLLDSKEEKVKVSSTFSYLEEFNAFSHTLEFSREGTSTVVKKQRFQANDAFQKSILEPLIVDFSRRNPLAFTSFSKESSKETVISSGKDGDLLWVEAGGLSLSPLLRTIQLANSVDGKENCETYCKEIKELFEKRKEGVSLLSDFTQDRQTQLYVHSIYERRADLSQDLVPIKRTYFENANEFQHEILEPLTEDFVGMSKDVCNIGKQVEDGTTTLYSLNNNGDFLSARSLNPIYAFSLIGKLDAIKLANEGKRQETLHASKSPTTK